MGVLCPRTANHAMLSALHTLCEPTCISLYVLYSARNVFKTIVGCDCYPLLVLRLPNDFLFKSEPKMARWDPLHQYWTTNSALGVDVNMGGSGLEWGRVNMGGYGVVDEWV